MVSFDAISLLFLPKLFNFHVTNLFFSSINRQTHHTHQFKNYSKTYRMLQHNPPTNIKIILTYLKLRIEEDDNLVNRFFNFIFKKPGNLMGLRL